MKTQRLYLGIARIYGKQEPDGFKGRRANRMPGARRLSLNVLLAPPHADGSGVTENQGGPAGESPARMLPAFAFRAGGRAPLLVRAEVGVSVHDVYKRALDEVGERAANSRYRSTRSWAWGPDPLHSRQHENRLKSRTSGFMLPAQRSLRRSSVIVATHLLPRRGPLPLVPLGIAAERLLRAAIVPTTTPAAMAESSDAAAMWSAKTVATSTPGRLPRKVPNVLVRGLHADRAGDQPHRREGCERYEPYCGHLHQCLSGAACARLLPPGMWLA